MMKKILLLGVCIVAFSCSEYQKVLKKNDIKPKYDMAIKFYDEGMETGKKTKLKKSIRLLEQILPQYRGKPQGERIAYIFSDAHYQLEDYFGASYQFERFAKAYPKSQKVEEAYYKGAKSYYYISPVYSKDQIDTYKAIEKFQQYISLYPDGQYIGEANELVGELRDKLDRKAFEIAQQYYHIEDYKSAIAAMANYIEDRPGAKYMEDAYFYKLKAAYVLSINSYRHLVEDRLEDAQSYVEDYEKYYPEGSHIEEVKEILEDINKRLNTKNQA
ncbi:MAG: outer membrane protein assembly factor BamD [Mesonia hippocampi]|uniref:outer membrane protein assembly factor BamD n=1 Tax=Mesonia hippocampi TaxID=1628250 RepID=UPI003F9A7961